MKDILEISRNQHKDVMEQTISKQSLLELANKYIKQSHLLPKGKQTWFDKQVLSAEKWSIINI